MSSQVVHALYDDDDVLLKAVKEVRAEKHHIEEVYTPFPVHGLDHAMGLAETRIAIMAFIYGIIGFSVAVTMINFIIFLFKMLLMRCHYNQNGLYNWLIQSSNFFFHNKR